MGSQAADPPSASGHDQHLWQMGVKLPLKFLWMKIPQSQPETRAGQVEYPAHVGGRES